MIDEEEYEDYEFENLNYDNRIRRKSCCCSRCYGKNY